MAIEGSGACVRVRPGNLSPAAAERAPSGGAVPAEIAEKMRLAAAELRSSGAAEIAKAAGREAERAAAAEAVSDEVVAAAEQGEEEAVQAWLEGGGRVDATYERGEVSGRTLLMGAATSGWSSCCCGTAQRWTCRTATASPR